MMRCLAGVRIQTAHGDAGAAQSPVAIQIRREDLENLHETRDAQRIAHRAQRQVRGGKRHPHRARSQHHHG